MEKRADLKIDSDGYIGIVNKDKSLMRLFKIILIAMFGASIGLYFNSSMAKTAREHAEQVAMEERAERIRGIYNQIMPQQIFNSSKEESGYLRQDLRSQLEKIGFVRDDEHQHNDAFTYNYAVTSSDEWYSLYMDKDDDAPIMQISLANEEPRYGAKQHDGITGILRIKILDHSFVDEYISAFKDNLTRCGFVTSSSNNIEPTILGTQLPLSFNYVRIGKTLREPGILSDDLFFNYDVVNFKKNYNDEMEIECRSKNDGDS